MKNVLLLFGLLATSISFAQTPFTHYFGETGRVNFIRDFTRTNEGNYLIHAYGNYSGQFDVDIANYQYELNVGLMDSTIVVEPASQLTYSAEETADGGAVVCARASTPEQLFSDILIQYLNEYGEETDRLVFGDGTMLSPVETAIDEEENYFVAYLRRPNPFQREGNSSLRMLNADHETVYDIALNPNWWYSVVLKLVPLGNGDVIAITYVLDEAGERQINVFRVANDGSIIWNKTFTLEEDDLFIVSNGFYDGEKLYFSDYIVDRIVTMDVADGSVLSSTLFPGNEILPSFRTPLVKYNGDIWMFGRTAVYRLGLMDTAYEIVASYPITQELLLSSRFRVEEGGWEFLDITGRLTYFDLNVEIPIVVANLNRPRRSYVQEAVTNVQAGENQFFAGILRFGNRDFIPIGNTITPQGELSNSSVLANQGDPGSMNPPEMLALPDGGIAVLSVVKNEQFDSQLRLDFYEEDGNLLSQNALIEFGSNIFRTYLLSWLPTGELGVYVRYSGFEGQTDLIYSIDLDNPDFAPVQMLDFTDTPNRFFSLEEGAVGFLSNVSTQENDVGIGINKVDLENGLTWSKEVVFSGMNDRRAYSFGRNNLLVNSPNGDVLLAMVLQDGDEAPELNMELYDGVTGTTLQSFASAKPYLSASVNFLNEDQIVVVGCSYNLMNSGADDRYHLHYEIYDLAGNLLRELTNDLPDQFIVTGLDVLEDGFLLVSGQVIQDSDTNTFLLLMNEGDIMTGLADLIPNWGELTVGPNPSSDLLRVQLENDFQGDVAVNVYSMGGRLMGNWSANKISEQMTWKTSLADLPNGSYWVQIKSTEGQVTAAWVKQ